MILVAVAVVIVKNAIVPANVKKTVLATAASSF